MTIRFAFTTAILPGLEAQYEAIHRVTPAELDRVIRTAGTRFWRIERNGSRLFHFVEVDDIDRFDAVLQKSEVNARWQIVVSPLLEPGASARIVVDHFDTEQGDLVWELPPAD